MRQFKYGLAIVILLIMCFTIYAQPITIPVTTPISGKFAVTGNSVNGLSGDTKQLFVIDTQTGIYAKLAENDLGILNPRWDNSGTKLVYGSGIDLRTFDTTTLTENVLLSNVSYLLAWSPDNQSILYNSSVLSSAHPEKMGLRRFDTATNTSNQIIEYTTTEPITTLPLPTLPNGRIGLNFSGIYKARWNPSYADWIILSLEGYNDFLEGSIPFAVAYNMQTGEALSVDQLFTEGLSYSVSLEWHPNGKYFLVNLNDDKTNVVVALEQVDANWQLREVNRFIPVNMRVVEWLGVSDLFLASAKDDATEDIVFYIAWGDETTWKSREFFRLPKTIFSQVGSWDWLLTADEAEKRTLSCIFDNTLVTRLQVGTRARVTFTDGTPSRLRSEPGTDNTVVTQMPEGTEFNVIGDPWCASGYRWWQLQLDDGTVGYAAEADTSEYFLEPVAS